MRIGPGGGGSSRRLRVNVSYRRTARSYSGPAGAGCARERFVPWRRRKDGSELRPLRGAGQRQAERAQVAADRLQLAHERVCLFVREPLGHGLAELREAVESRPRVLAELDRLG